MTTYLVGTYLFIPWHRISKMIFLKRSISGNYEMNTLNFMKDYVFCFLMIYVYLVGTYMYLYSHFIRSEEKCFPMVRHPAMIYKIIQQCRPLQNYNLHAFPHPNWLTMCPKQNLLLTKLHIPLS